MRFIYSSIKTDKKPAGNEVKLYQRKESFLFKEGLSVVEIAELICEGRAWRAGDYEKGYESFKKQNVLGSYIIALDFDKTEATPQEVAEYSISLGIIPNFTYYSYSQGIKEGNNFRMVYVFDELIDKKQYEQIYIVMLELFSKFGVDKSTKDCSRLWFGSKLPPTIINKEFSRLSTLGWVSILNKYKEVEQTRALMRNKKGYIPEYSEIEMPSEVEVGRHWEEKLRVRCVLWDDWCKGKYLNYNQRLTLMTNLKFLKYSDNNGSVVKDILKYYKPEVYAGHTCNIEQLSTMLRERSLTPLPIVLKNDGSYETIPQFFSSEESKVVLNPIKKCTLAELDAWLDKSIPEFLTTKGIGYLKSQTASGKTERIINFLLGACFYERKIIYAVPTYEVLNEFTERLLSKLEPDNLLRQFVTPIPKAEITDTDAIRIELGLSKECNADEERGKAVADLIAKETGLFIVSHQLLASLAEVKADLIIIDENVEETLLKESIITRKAIESLKKYVDSEQAKNILTEIAVELTKKEFGTKIDITRLEIIKKELKGHLNAYIGDCKSGLVTPAVGLFSTKDVTNAKITIVSEEPAIRFIKKSGMITNAIEHKTPVKMFTATPKVTLIRKYFTESIKVLEAPLAENAGRIYQYTKYSGAKGSNGEKIPELIKYIKEELKEKVDLKEAVFLSFKNFANTFEKEGFNVPKNIDGEVIHLQNNAGMDCYKGKNVIVAGKFDYPQSYYYNVYSDLHPEEEKIELPPLQNKLITFGGNIEQRIYTYVDEELSEIQLQNLELTLTQSAGRARALRAAGASVYIFSDFIIPDADEIIK